jgi:CheY-like chemotaxis protein
MAKIWLGSQSERESCMLKVIIAEDDLVMADMLEDVLVAGGYEVCGIARTVEEALDLSALHRPDLAVLDVQLAGGDRGTAIGAQLHRPGGPGILYATGNMGLINLADANGEACLVKPYGPTDILRALEIVEQILSTGKASRPFPRGFYVLD